MTRAAIYTRVSTRGQLYNTSFSRQTDYCETWAANEGMEIVVRAYECSSGAPDRRPCIDALRVMAQRGEFEVLLVEANDRLTRFGSTNLYDDFSAVGVKVEVTAPWAINQRTILMGLISEVAQQISAATEPDAAP